MGSVAPALAAATGGTGQANQITHLSGTDGAWALATIGVFVLLAGIVVIIGRRWLEGPKSQKSGDATGATKTETGTGTGATGGASTATDSGGSTLVRSWLAISLVGGLLVLVPLSFWLDNTSLQSTLVGGVVANAGAAVAFYFASKSADQAQSNILAAALGTALVPNLIGKDSPGAHAAVAATPFRLEVHPATPADGARVVSQTPVANQSATAGAPVAATFAGPVPNIVGKSLDIAQSLVEAAGLQLDPSPVKPDSTTVVRTQDPTAGGIPNGLKVRATFG
jgi:hypothetical protein